MLRVGLDYFVDIGFQASAHLMISHIFSSTSVCQLNSDPPVPLVSKEVREPGRISCFCSSLSWIECNKIHILEKRQGTT